MGIICKCDKCGQSSWWQQKPVWNCMHCGHELDIKTCEYEIVEKQHKYWISNGSRNGSPWSRLDKLYR